MELPALYASWYCLSNLYECTTSYRPDGHGDRISAEFGRDFLLPAGCGPVPFPRLVVNVVPCPYRVVGPPHPGAGQVFLRWKIDWDSTKDLLPSDGWRWGYCALFWPNNDTLLLNLGPCNPQWIPHGHRDCWVCLGAGGGQYKQPDEERRGFRRSRGRPVRSWRILPRRRQSAGRASRPRNWETDGRLSPRRPRRRRAAARTIPGTAR